MRLGKGILCIKHQLGCFFLYFCCTPCFCYYFSVPHESSFAISNKENERFHNPTMVVSFRICDFYTCIFTILMNFTIESSLPQVTGYALRKPDVNGSVFESSFTTQNEPPLPTRKRARKCSSKNKTNPVVALEQHFEQIRRKHAEFNWYAWIFDISYNYQSFLSFY